MRAIGSKNNSVWASKAGNSGSTESATYSPRTSGVSGQHRPSGGEADFTGLIPAVGRKEVSL